MTPKEKATELIEKFRKATDGIAAYNYNDVNIECALISVEEIISSWGSYNERYEQELFDAELKYWQEVKQELENL